MKEETFLMRHQGKMQEAIKWLKNLKPKSKEEIKLMGTKSISIQVKADYQRLFEENEYMTPRNARRILVSEWNLPMDLIKEMTL